MLPYFLMIFIPLLFQVTLQITNTRLKIGRTEKYITWDTIALPTFFLVYLLLLTLRSETLGRDLPNYKYIFNYWGRSSLQNVVSQPQEILFHLYCWFVYNYVSSSFQVFLAVTALLTVVPIMCVYNGDKKQGYLKIAVFVNMSTFIMTFSGIRQSLAFAAGILAYRFLVNKKKLRFLLLALIATFIHHSGFMVLFFYPLYSYHFKKKDLIWLVPAAAMIIVFNRQIFNLLSILMGSISDDYGVVAGSTGAYSSFVLFLMFTILCYVIVDEKKADEEVIFLRNIMTFSTVLQSFAALNTLAMRMNYYFIILIPVALGKCIGCTRKKYEQVSIAAELVISVYFTLIFVINTYRSAVTGISALDTVPYIPFWKG